MASALATLGSGFLFYGSNKIVHRKHFTNGKNKTVFISCI